MVLHSRSSASLSKSGTASSYSRCNEVIDWTILKGEGKAFHQRGQKESTERSSPAMRWSNDDSPQTKRVVKKTTLYSCAGDYGGIAESQKALVNGERDASKDRRWRRQGKTHQAKEGWKGWSKRHERQEALTGGKLKTSTGARHDGRSLGMREGIINGALKQKTDILENFFHDHKRPVGGDILHHCRGSSRVAERRRRA